MRILVVGGGGYIGSALLKHLAEKHHCLCFGHGGLYTELREKIRGEVEFIEGDLNDGNLLRKVLRGADAVIHVAGIGGESACLSDPARAVLTHVLGTHVLRREATRQNIERFIYASTIAVYGTYHSRPMPLTEAMELQPDDFYGSLKATAERDLIDGSRFQILRLANVYGYGSGSSLFKRSSGVIGKLIEASQRGASLQVYGDGRQLIDYVHVDDVCDAFEKALDRPGENFVYNLGGGRPVSVRSIAELIARTASVEFNRQVDIAYLKETPHKIWPDRWLSIKKADREMRWRPRVQMAMGVREMMAS